MNDLKWVLKVLGAQALAFVIPWEIIRIFCQ